MEPQTGFVKAWVGGNDYNISNTTMSSKVSVMARPSNHLSMRQPLLRKTIVLACRYLMQRFVLKKANMG